MHRRLLPFGFVALLSLASCSAPPPSVAMQLPEAPAQEPIMIAKAPAATPFAPRTPITSLTMEGYKKEFALRIATTTPRSFTTRCPRCSNRSLCWM